jgi:hypothetical protein
MLYLTEIFSFPECSLQPQTQIFFMFFQRLEMEISKLIGPVTIKISSKWGIAVSIMIVSQVYPTC